MMSATPDTAAAPVGLRSAARSDIGIIRDSNEDSGYASTDLLVVADGMGGHAAGELASAAAVATFAELEPGGLGEKDALSRMADAVTDVAERIADVVAETPQYAGMGTTLTALAWLGEPDRIALVHIGDSRAYLLRDGDFSQLTRDHTYVQMLIDSGRLRADEVAEHPRRNLLMRAIDGIHPAEPDMSVREARPGDRFLLCSDGLSAVLTDSAIAQLLHIEDRVAAVTALVDAALAGGAPDNVTCIVADVIAKDASASAEDRQETRAVVVGAAGERAIRSRLPDLHFPVDAEPERLSVNSAVDPKSGGPKALAGVYAEEMPARRGGWRPTAAIAVGVVLTLIAVAITVVVWTSRQWYVGDDGGYVTVFRGVPASLGPVELHTVVERSTLTTSSLPTFEGEQVRSTIFAASQEAATETVARLQTRALQCAEKPATAGCPGAPT